MNIVIVNDFSHINGGAGQVALSSAIAFAKLGHRVTLFSAVAPVMLELQVAGIDIIVTGQYEILKDRNRLRAAIQGIWNFKSQKAMGKLLASLDAATTIVHVHSWSKALSASVVREAITRNFKVVCTLHDYFSACPNGGFFDYKRRTICKLTPLSVKCLSTNCDVRNYPQKLWRVARQVVQRSVGLIPSGIKNFITISDFSEIILKPYLPTGATLHRVENPTNVAKQNCVDAGSNDSYTFVGRLSPEKAATMFANAAYKLGVPSVFVGEGADRAEIESINPNALITGWVSTDQVMEYLSAARVLVFPSLLYEGCPLVIAEAAALGIPAIVPDTCAARDLVVDGITGLWFRGGDMNDLLEKMRFMQNPEVASKLGSAAYDSFWKEPNTMERHISKLLGCYIDILKH